MKVKKAFCFELGIDALCTTYRTGITRTFEEFMSNKDNCLNELIIKEFNRISVYYYDDWVSKFYSHEKGKFIPENLVEITYSSVELEFTEYNNIIFHIKAILVYDSNDLRPKEEYRQHLNERRIEKFGNESDAEHFCRQLSEPVIFENIDEYQKMIIKQIKSNETALDRL